MVTSFNAKIQDKLKDREFWFALSEEVNLMEQKSRISLVIDLQRDLADGLDAQGSPR